MYHENEGCESDERLSKKEITNIFSDAIDAIVMGGTPSLNLDSGLEEDTDYSEDDESASGEETDVAEVILGCKVVVRNEKNETKMYKYDLMHGVLPKALEIFTGHKAGDVIEMLGNE